ncbi:MAG: 50S ribosomal protein L23 [Patescibacteria group bacterium]
MSVIKRQYLTERSSLLSEKGIYSFVVTSEANKSEIAKALETKYKVKPINVRVINTKGKVVVRGYKKGRKAGMRKAYVKFPAGTKIESV